MSHQISQPRAPLPAVPVWHQLEADEVARLLESDASRGLTGEVARTRLARDGPNTLRPAKTRSPWIILGSQLRSLVVILLAAAAALAFAVGEGAQATAVLVVLVLNALIGFVTEFRAETAMVALQRQAALDARVERDGVLTTVPAHDLVAGDLIALAAGDRVPADARIIEQVRLEIDEASLTGESVPVAKNVASQSAGADDLGLADRSNMAYLGTVVTSGRARALVVATGARTEVGHIGTLVEEAVRRETPLERRLDQLGRSLVAIVGALCAVIIGLGVWRGQPLAVMLEMGISLAIAAVPEGLPAVATMTLALGAQRMARAQALVRRLPAVETLGSTSVICTDKTGTLTLNQMAVTRVVLLDADLEVLPRSEAETEPCRSFAEGGEPVTEARLAVVRLALRIGALCNDAAVQAADDGSVRVHGDPMEGALIVAAHKSGQQHQHLLDELPRIDEIPFDSAKKHMVTVHRTSSGTRVAFIKGSPGTLLVGASAIQDGESARPITAADRTAMEAANERLAGGALRVLALAYRTLDPIPRDGELEDGWTFVGLVGLVDPVRPEARAAIERCHSAGIRTVMLTGDQPLTASAVAVELGLVGDFEGAPRRAAHAREIDPLDDEALGLLVDQVGVFARVSPAHKLRIIEALQRRDQVVAMTGDGVNDAPALRRADIGIAMGTGTAVAKEAADIVLRDDNFATLVTAIEQGRIVYANIKRFIHFLFSCNLSEVLTVFTAILLGWPLPLAALQILWLNIVTDVFPAMALALEPSSPGAMQRPPRPASEALLTPRFGALIAWQAIVLATVTLAGFAIAMRWHGTDATGLPRATTVAFCVLALVQTFHVFNARSLDRSIFSRQQAHNPWIWGAVLLCLGLQVAAVELPALQQVLGTSPLDTRDWLLVGGLALAPLVVVELVKLATRSRRQAQGPAIRSIGS